MPEQIHHPASYKDPSGFIFSYNGKYYRQINLAYKEDYELFISSGLYSKLKEENLLIAHEEINKNLTGSQNWYSTLLPRQISFISYPYEWCFDQLKDAALLTLKIMKVSINHGMILKDATGFNVQFEAGKPIFIDTLSFEKYDEKKPWIAYRQFCESFLFPLLIEHYREIDAQKLLSIFLDGIPVGVTSKLLPGKSKTSLSVWLHVFLQNRVGNSQSQQKNHVAFSKTKLIRLIDHLESTIRRLTLNSSHKSTWNHYYDETILSQNYLSVKENIFRELLPTKIEGRVMDLGCNDGYFSKILAERSDLVIAADFDSQCINRLYLSEKSKGHSNILPLCIDLTNPPPSTGFRNAERQSFATRAQSEWIAALALVHHLVLSKNIPLGDVAMQLADLCSNMLIIEFVPLEDEKSQQLIRLKTNYHKPYDVPAFESFFGQYFDIVERKPVPGTERLLYCMKKK
ncbi:MAG: SAM-dependent methyltransferase [Bacteroidetes bacterium]|nr:MAG: SAM-dependent methyltransferase [Bacteroidota bacterium]